MAAHSNILAGEFHGQRSLVDYSLWGLKELETTERLTHTQVLKFSGIYTQIYQYLRACL